MKAIIEGKVYVLGDDIDTDQIIPAQHLVISLSDPKERKRYGGYALSAVPKRGAGLPKGGIPFSDTETNESRFRIVVAGKNFGCGSSREHAPVALNEAGTKAVVASSFARIFYRNAVDGGYFPPFETTEDLTQHFSTNDEAVLDTKNATLTNKTTGVAHKLRDLGAAKEIVEAGGLFAYARNSGLIENQDG